MKGSTTRLKRSPEPDLSEGRSGDLRDRRHALFEGRKDLVHGRMVSRLAARVAIHDVSPGSDHENAAELPGIALNTGLSRTRAERTKGIEWKSRREYLDPTAPQARGAIRAELGIHQDRTVELEVLAERCGKVLGSVPDDDELGTPSANLVDPVAQLRDLLTTEQSAEVADEHQDDRPLLPERFQTYTRSLPIRELDPGELCRSAHRTPRFDSGLVQTPGRGSHTGA